jgi:hypothetical protein
MTVATHQRHHHAAPLRRMTLVWIDSRQALIVRWQEDRGLVERVASDVPAHRRSTGEMGPDPSVETQRLDHLERFVASVAQRLPADDDVLLLGPGTVRGHLERYLRAADHGRDRPRALASEAAATMTERQLIARLRDEIGVPPRRRRALRPPHTRSVAQPPRQKHVPIAELDLPEEIQ